MARFACFFMALAAVLLAPVARAQSGAEAAFQKFFAADSPDAAAHSVADIEKAGVTFDEALAAVEGGTELCGAAEWRRDAKEPHGGRG